MNVKRLARLSVLPLGFAGVSPAWARRPVASAVAISQAPAIDGVLDDRAWQDATPLTGLKGVRQFDILN